MTAIVPVRTSIAAGQALSGSVASVGYGVCLVLLPAAWTDAPLTLQGSLDEGEPAAWADLHDHLGNEVVLTVASGRELTLPPALLLGWRWLRLRAGLDASTPAAIIENGGTPEMHVLAGTLSSFARDGQGRSRGGPALVLLGEVVDPAAGSSAARLRLAEPCSGA